MNKGDYSTIPVDSGPPPDFCAMGRHADEIIVTDVIERVCNDCGRREQIGPDECIDGSNDWWPEHDYHFGVCSRCDAVEDDGADDEDETEEVQF